MMLMKEQAQVLATQEVSAEAKELGERFARLVDTMRGNAQFDLDCFLRAFERGMGAKMVVEVSSDRSRRGNAEVHYCSEGLALQAS